MEQRKEKILSLCLDLEFGRRETNRGAFIHFRNGRSILL